MAKDITHYINPTMISPSFKFLFNDILDMSKEQSFSMAAMIRSNNNMLLNGKLQRHPKEARLSADYVPTEFDVICGRGQTYHHIGNRRLRILVTDNMHRYCGAVRHGKGHVVDAVIEQVLKTGGRFLRHDKAMGAWFEVTVSTARGKVGHAFRDANSAAGKRRSEKGKRKSPTTRLPNKRKPVNNQPEDGHSSVTNQNNNSVMMIGLSDLCKPGGETILIPQPIEMEFPTWRNESVSGSSAMMTTGSLEQLLQEDVMSVVGAPIDNKKVCDETNPADDVDAERDINLLVDRMVQEAEVNSTENLAPEADFFCDMHDSISEFAKL